MANAQILIVEDDGITAKHIHNNLKSSGYVVPAIAFSGEEAIQRTAETQPDLVLMDIRLQGDMDGAEAAERIRARFDIPVVYLTAYSDEATLQRAKITEPFGYVLKPFEERDLRATIEMALYKHRLDKELKESRQWLATTLKSIGDAVIATDIQGSVKFVNPVAEGLTGWRQEEALGKDLAQVFSIINEDTHTLAESPVTKAIREGIVVGLANHTLLVARDGKEIPIADSAAPIRDDKGNITGVVLTFRDVAERRRAEEALRESEERFRTVANFTYDWEYWVGVDGNYIFISPSCERITGYSADEFLRNPGLLELIVHPDDRALLAQHLHEGLDSSEVFVADLRITTASGQECWISHVCQPVYGDDGRWLGRRASNRDITARKRAEQELRESERRLREVLENVQLVAVMLDTRGHIVFCNDFMLELTGWRRDEIMGQNWFDVFVPPNEEAKRVFFETIKQGTVPLHFESVILTRQEERRLISWNNTSLRDPQGRVIGTAHIGEDITEHKQAEEALRVSEERYKQRSAELQALYDVSLRLNAQLETPGLLHLIVEQATKLLEAEAGCLYIYDQEHAELTVSVATGYFGEFVDRTLKPGEGLAGKVFESRRSMAVEDYSAWPGRAKIYEGESRFKATLAVPLLGAGSVLGVLDVGSGQRKRTFDEHDMWLAELFAAQAAVALESTRLHAEVYRRAMELAALNKAGQAITSILDRGEMLKLVMTEVRSLLDSEGASVLLLDPTGEELIFVAVTGPSSEKLLGSRMPAAAGIAGWVMQKRCAALTTDARSDARFYDRIDMLTGLSTRSLVVVPLILKDTVIGVVEAINKAVGTFSDHDLEMLEIMAGSAVIAIENARLFQAEREQFRHLQESQAQLVHAEKMTALGRLTASFAHEINNPLQAVQGCLSLVEEELQSDLRRDKMQRYLGVAGNEIERMATIVRRMRDFYRPAREGMQRTDVHAVLENMLELTHKQLQHSNVTVECEFASDLPLIQANPDYLKQVFLNLVLNAADAMAAPGGTLRVRTTLDQLPSEGRGGIEGKGRPAVRIEFEDTGAGMSPEIISHLFEPFFTTKEGGTGLGLSISYGIIEAHGGRITATSQIGAGTTFTIRLPVTQAAK